MFPEPLLHLRAAIRRGLQPDKRDLNWLAKNPSYLMHLTSNEKMLAQHYLQGGEQVAFSTES